MALYEHVFIARQDISSAQAQTLIETFSEIIESKGGTVPKKEYWGLKTMAYRIKKNRKGHYALMNIDAPSEAVQEMERLMRLNEDVLRYLTVRVHEHDPEPSPPMQRGARDDRGGRDGRRDRPPRADRPATDKPKADKPKADDAETDIAKAGETKADETKKAEADGEDAKAEAEASTPTAKEPAAEPETAEPADEKADEKNKDDKKEGDD